MCARDPALNIPVVSACIQPSIGANRFYHYRGTSTYTAAAVAREFRTVDPGKEPWSVDAAARKHPAKAPVVEDDDDDGCLSFRHEYDINVLVGNNKTGPEEPITLGTHVFYVFVVRLPSPRAVSLVSIGLD